MYFGLMLLVGGELLNDEEWFMFLNWFFVELGKYNVLRLEEKLCCFEFGNYIEYEKFFLGEYVYFFGFIVDWWWLISEFIFDVKINCFVDYVGRWIVYGVEMEVVGDNGVNFGIRFGG